MNKELHDYIFMFYLIIIQHICKFFEMFFTCDCIISSKFSNLLPKVIWNRMRETRDTQKGHLLISLHVNGFSLESRNGRGTCSHNLILNRGISLMGKLERWKMTGNNRGCKRGKGWCILTYCESTDNRGRR